jgi:two-component system sensor histidine kinase PhoQ
VLESRATLDRESQAFSRTLWGWLAGAGVLLLLAQGLLLRWGLQPLRRVAGEIARVESGAQAELQGRYPAELAGLTSNLNTLLRQERVRQTRYKEALSFLAHSLKTPLAVLRNALGQPPGAAQDLPATVAQQVDRMDHIVQHQLGRAMASGAARFVPPLALAPVAQRVRDSLAKVYAAKGVQITLDAPPGLAWRLDEGDAFELLGNLMDNAVKWATATVAVRLWQEGTALRLRVDDDGPGFTQDTQAVLQVEAVQVHHLGPRGHKVAHKLGHCIGLGVHLGNGAQLRVGTEHQVHHGCLSTSQRRFGGRGLHTPRWRAMRGSRRCPCPAGW